MKPNQIIMTLSILGLSCSYALAENNSSIIEARINSADEYAEDLDWLSDDFGNIDNYSNARKVTADNFLTTPTELESAADINVDEDFNEWTQPNIALFAKKLANTNGKYIWFNPSTSEQFLRYNGMIAALTEANVDAFYGVNLNQNHRIIEPKIFAAYWTKAAAKRPLRIRVNQQSATPFLNVLSRVSSSSISGGKPIVIDGLTPEYAGELKAAVEKNPPLKGKITIKLADFKKFGYKTGSELIYGGVGITGQRGMITVNPIDRNHFKVELYGLDGTQIKPVVWSKPKLDDNIIKKIFKQPVV